MADATAIASTRASRTIINAGYGTICITARLFASLRAEAEAVAAQLPGNAFLDPLPSDREPMVFARLLQESGLDLIYSFVLIFPASFDSSSNKITAELDASFTYQRTPDGTFEAIVAVGSARR